MGRSIAERFFCVPDFSFLKFDLIIMRTIFIFITSFLACSASTAQVQQWSLVDGRAKLQTVITAPDKDAAFLYKQVNRWLIATFKNPEDVLKARIESEYLRGEAYHSNFLQLGALSAMDFQYTFAIDIKDDKVRLTLFNGVVLYDDDPQNTNGAYSIEQYFETASKRKKDYHAENVIATVNTLSNSLLKSLESFLLSDVAKIDDW